jgi:mRNA interferase MazF
MISEGDIVLFRFPQSDLQGGKLRPALLLKKIPSQYDDWLVCMISSQLRHRIEDFELVILESDPSFPSTGLKRDSLIRSSRLAVIDSAIIEGTLGMLPPKTIHDIRAKLSGWIHTR